MESLSNNPFMTPVVIFLINNRNFHSDVCDGSCLFLRTPHPADGVNVFKQQAPSNHHVHVHVPNPCINLRFVCIVRPFALTRYCSLHVRFYVSNKQIIVVRFPPNRGLLQQFFFNLFAAYYAMALLILNGLIIEAGCSSINLFVCGICG